MNAILLSHQPHATRLLWAKSIGAKVKVLPLSRFVTLSKKFRLMAFLILPLSLIISLFIRVRDEVLIVDGSTSLYVAVFVKWRKRNVKLVYLDVDIRFSEIDKTKRKVRYSLIRIFYKAVDAAISDSEQNRRFLPAYLDVPKYVCVPVPQEVKERKRSEKKKYGLYLGRVEPDKKIKRIMAFGLQCPHIEKLIVVGSGSQKAYVKRLSAKEKKIEYWGQQSNVGKYYNLCEFLIHLPDIDPHPCTTMEAALAGCFPIISKGVGTAYLFDKRFVMNNPDDFEDINEKMKFILDHKEESRELLRKSSKLFPTKETSAKDFRNIFEKILADIKN